VGEKILPLDQTVRQEEGGEAIEGRRDLPWKWGGRGGGREGGREGGRPVAAGISLGGGLTVADARGYRCGNGRGPRIFGGPGQVPLKFKTEEMREIGRFEVATTEDVQMGWE
jgi:hypothetical protein